jgi:phosphoribosylaminoimidazole-succinocarboxamide synthase
VNSGELLYSGKAKSIYAAEGDDEAIMVFRDDITAFDGGKKDTLSRKGSFNSRVSGFLFDYLGKAGIKTHFVEMVNETSMRVRRLEMIPLEVIVRNIAAGSLVRNYPFREGTPLSPPIIVMDYKDDARHDPMLNDDIILALGLVNADELETIRQMARKINDLLIALFDEVGITLVDFKIEFGRYNGEIYLGDEISMDSMRLWDTSTGESLDKDVYRFEKGDVMDVYRRVAEKILGR